MQYAPTRVHEKPGGFYTQTFAAGHFGVYAFAPYTGTCKIWQVLYPNLWRGSFWGVCNTPLHGYMKNLAGFGLCHTTWRETRRVLDFATRHGAKPGRFWTLPHDMARNPAGFELCHTTWRETRRVLDFATRHGAKSGGFLTLPHDMARNPAGFSHCHTT